MRHIPRIVLAGLSGGAGKTLVSLGLVRALADSGLRVQPFKKGPDYIDAAWLGLAAKRPCSNLDPFLMDQAVMARLLNVRCRDADMAVIEGNRGLFDGKDTRGTCSTAELARGLQAPVVLVLDATKMTRTAAAIVLGCKNFEPGLNLAGVVLNRTANDRHRSLLRSCIETHTGLPVLGLLPKVADNPIPERHMGLVSDQEHGGSESALARIGRLAADCLDLDALRNLARSAPGLPDDPIALWPKAGGSEQTPVIGYVHDAAFWFYYPENLEALQAAGARLVRVSLLDEAPWPELHGLYLGGGFPETLAQALAANAAARRRVKDLADSGLPIYAECGGFMYLCEALEYGGQRYPMAGVFPLTTRLCAKPQGLGYVEAEVVAENPFHAKGSVIRGHEFHYSACLSAEPQDAAGFGLKLRRGHGIQGGLDGLMHRNTFAAYTHIHALGEPQWAGRFVAAARSRRDG